MNREPPPLTVPEIVDVINPPHKALGLGYFASLTMRKMSGGSQGKAYLRLNIKPGGTHLIDRGYFTVTPSGILDMTHARLQSTYEYRVAEGLLVGAVQRLRQERAEAAKKKVVREPSTEEARDKKLDAYAQALSRARKYPVKHAVIAIRHAAKEVAGIVGCDCDEVVEWAKRR